MHTLNLGIRMSNLFCCLIYRPKHFNPRCLQKAMHGVQAAGEGESLLELALTADTRVVFYRPPHGLSKSEGYEEGYAWFEENLYRDLMTAMEGEAGTQQIYLLAYEDIADTQALWILGPKTYEFMAIHTDDTAEHVKYDENGNPRQQTQDISIDTDSLGDPESEAFEQAYAQARAMARVPYSALSRLQKDLNISLDDLLEALHKMDGAAKRVWPDENN